MRFCFQRGSGGGGANSITRSITVPADRIGLMIGKGGETVRYLQNQSGARIQVDQQASTRHEKTVNITGSAQAVEAAERLIQETLDGQLVGFSTCCC